MEREIKFKFWNNETKTMSCSWSIWDLEYEWFPEEYNYENWKVLQFTGLKDKNWKEIYEGDVIEFNEEEWGNNTTNIHIVEWDEDEAQFSMGWWCQKSDCEFRTVIWNIYENPELLNK